MTSGLALVAADTRSRLFTIRGMIHDAMKTPGFKVGPNGAVDPNATDLCAVLSLTEQAIEILQQQVGSQAAPGLPAGGSNE